MNMKKLIKRLKMISFSVMIALIISCFTNKAIAKEVDYTKEEMIKKYENIVFLGDSITEYYPINEIYSDLPVIKSGIAGYKTNDILSRLDELVYKYNPTSVYLLIGTNDLIMDKEEDKVSAVNNIKEIIENIKKHRKKTDIYIESIYPINKNLDKEKYMVGQRENTTIMNVNNKIKKYCKENNYHYIDMYNQLLDKDGNFSKEYTDDGLHPNDLGYAKITRVLLPYIYGIKK